MNGREQSQSETGTIHDVRKRQFGQAKPEEEREAQISELNKEIDALRAQIVKMRSEQPVSEKKQGERSAKMDAIRAENDRLKAEIESLEAALRAENDLLREEIEKLKTAPETEKMQDDTAIEPDAVARIEEAEDFAAQKEVRRLQLLLEQESSSKERAEADMRTKNGVISNLEKRIETLTEQVRRMKGEAASLRAGLIEEADIAEDDPTYRDACRLYDDPGMTLQQWRNHVARAKSLKRQKKWAVLLEQLIAYGEYLGYNKDTGF